MMPFLQWHSVKIKLMQDTMFPIIFKVIILKAFKILEQENVLERN